MSTVNSNIKIGKKNAAFFAANPALVLLDGQLIYNEDTGDLFIGDGVTPLIGLTPINSGFTPSGTNLDYIAGDGSYITFPTDNAAFTNGAGYLSSGDINVTVQAYSASTTLLGNSTTGSGSIVLATSPTFGTDITTPKIIGGAGVTSKIEYFGTSGNGTSTAAAHEFKVGNNGASTIASFYNDQKIVVGTSNTRNSGTQGIFRIWQGTEFIDFGSRASGQAGLWMGQGTPSNFNHTIYASTALTVLNGNSLNLQCGAANVAAFTSFGEVTFTTSGARTSGAFTAFTITSPTNTGQTASTNIPNFRVNGSTKTWAAGTLATQYFNYFTANTVAFASASTATMPVNLYVEAPLAGANCTATNLAAIGCGGHLFIANSVGVPANNPTGGGLLYVEAGALKYRGSSGTVTTIANA